VKSAESVVELKVTSYTYIYKVVIALTVKDILEEEIARKLA